MPHLRIFTYFPLLPREIQDMIWSHSLTPQLISLSLEIYSFTPQHAPSFMFLLGGDEPYSHFTMETIPRPNSPYFTAHLAPVNHISPVALSVCQESRRFALANGYKAWRIVHRNGKLRDVMWNPSTDTVFCVNADALHSFPLFLEQFPTQVKEVRRLALPQSFWPSTVIDPKFTRELLWRPLMRLTALEEFFIFVDKEFWEAWVPNQDGAEDQYWEVPTDVGRSLLDARRDYQEKYQESHGPSPIEVPRVSVAWSHDMILRGEDVKLWRLAFDSEDMESFNNSQY